MGLGKASVTHGSAEVGAAAGRSTMGIGDGRQPGRRSHLVAGERVYGATEPVRSGTGGHAHHVAGLLRVQGASAGYAFAVSMAGLEVAGVTGGSGDGACNLPHLSTCGLAAPAEGVSMMGLGSRDGAAPTTMEVMVALSRVRHVVHDEAAIHPTHYPTPPIPLTLPLPTHFTDRHVTPHLWQDKVSDSGGGSGGAGDGVESSAVPRPAAAPPFHAGGIVRMPPKLERLKAAYDRAKAWAESAASMLKMELAFLPPGECAPSSSTQRRHGPSRSGARTI